MQVLRFCICLFSVLPAAQGETPNRLPDLPRIWNATAEHPLPVFKLVRYPKSGPMGLNNILWAVGNAIHNGCLRAQELLRQRQAYVAQGAAPLAFVVVILPPLRKELGLDQKGAMHAYGEVFDLNRQLEFSLKYRNCFISDTKQWEILKKTGSVALTKDAATIKNYESPHFRGPNMHRVYQALEMSTHLRRKYYEPCVKKMRARFHPEMAYTAIHMRVEDDWVHHCNKMDHLPKPQKIKLRSKFKIFRYCFGAAEIAKIVLNTPVLANMSRNYLLIYAEDKVDLNLLSRPKTMRADPMKVWPPEIAVTNPITMDCFSDNKASYTERSIISLFMASDANAFVSTKLSTFQAGVNILRASRITPGHDRHSYLYDGDGKNFRFATSDTTVITQYSGAPPYVMNAT